MPGTTPGLPPRNIAHAVVPGIIEPDAQDGVLGEHDSTFYEYIEIMAKAGPVTDESLRYRLQLNNHHPPIQLLSMNDHDPIFTLMFDHPDKFRDITNCMWVRKASEEPRYATTVRLFPVNLREVMNMADVEPLVAGLSGSRVTGERRELSARLVLWSLRHSTEIVRNSGGWVDIDTLARTLGSNTPTILFLLSELETTSSVDLLGHKWSDVEEMKSRGEGFGLVTDDYMPKALEFDLPWNRVNGDFVVPRLVRATTGHSVSVVSPDRMYLRVDLNQWQNLVPAPCLFREPDCLRRSDMPAGICPGEGAVTFDPCYDCKAIHVLPISPLSHPDNPIFDRDFESPCLILDTVSWTSDRKKFCKVYANRVGVLLVYGSISFRHVKQVCTISRRQGSSPILRTFYDKALATRTPDLESPSFAQSHGNAGYDQAILGGEDTAGRRAVWGNERVVWCQCGEFSRIGCLKCLACGLPFGYTANPIRPAVHAALVAGGAAAPVAVAPAQAGQFSPRTSASGPSDDAQTDVARAWQLRSAQEQSGRIQARKSNKQIAHKGDKMNRHQSRWDMEPPYRMKCSRIGKTRYNMSTGSVPPWEAIDPDSNPPTGFDPDSVRSFFLAITNYLQVQTHRKNVGDTFCDTSMELIAFRLWPFMNFRTMEPLHNYWNNGMAVHDGGASEYNNKMIRENRPHWDATRALLELGAAAGKAAGSSGSSVRLLDKQQVDEVATATEKASAVRLASAPSAATLASSASSRLPGVSSASQWLGQEPKAKGALPVPAVPAAPPPNSQTSGASASSAPAAMPVSAAVLPPPMPSGPPAPAKSEPAAAATVVLKKGDYKPPPESLVARGQAVDESHLYESRSRTPKKVVAATAANVRPCRDQDVRETDKLAAEKAQSLARIAALRAATETGASGFISLNSDGTPKPPPPPAPKTREPSPALPLPGSDEAATARQKAFEELSASWKEKEAKNPGVPGAKTPEPQAAASASAPAKEPVPSPAAPVAEPPKPKPVAPTESNVPPKATVSGVAPAPPPWAPSQEGVPAAADFASQAASMRPDSGGQGAWAQFRGSRVAAREAVASASDASGRPSSDDPARGQPALAPRQHSPPRIPVSASHNYDARPARFQERRPDYSLLPALDHYDRVTVWTPAMQPRRPYTCFRCGMQGHKTYECWGLFSEELWPAKYQCVVCGGNHPASRCNLDPEGVAYYQGGYDRGRPRPSDNPENFVAGKGKGHLPGPRKGEGKGKEGQSLRQYEFRPSAERASDIC